MDKKTSLQIYDELRKESKKSYPHLRDVLKEIGPLPHEAVVMGVVAADDLPLLFDTSTWGGSPNILVWNGETSFLKVVAEYILNRDDYEQEKDEIEFVVFTNNIEEWEFLTNKTNQVKNTPCIGVIPFWSDIANQVLLALGNWIQEGRHPNHSVIVLVEGIENILSMDLDSRLNFGHLLMRGGSQRVFTIGTVKSENILRGLEDRFKLHASYDESSDMYEFPEGEGIIQIWLPKTSI